MELDSEFSMSCSNNWMQTETNYSVYHLTCYFDGVIAEDIEKWDEDNTWAESGLEDDEQFFTHGPYDISLTQYVNSDEIEVNFDGEWLIPGEEYYGVHMKMKKVNS